MELFSPRWYEILGAEHGNVSPPFSSWAGVFGDQVVVAAMIDRNVRHTDVIALKGRLLPAARRRCRYPVQQ